MTVMLRGMGAWLTCEHRGFTRACPNLLAVYSKEETGLREALLAKLKEVASKEGLKTICMEADSADATAMRFLEANGFARVASTLPDVAAFEFAVAPVPCCRAN